DVPGPVTSARGGITSDVRPVLVFVRRLHEGLQSLRSIRRIEARRRKASALWLRFSQSLARRRHRLSQAMDRSTIQRLGSTTKPLARSERLTISTVRLRIALAAPISEDRSGWQVLGDVAPLAAGAQHIHHAV